MTLLSYEEPPGPPARAGGVSRKLFVVFFVFFVFMFLVVSFMGLCFMLLLLLFFLFLWLLLLSLLYGGPGGGAEVGLAAPGAGTRAGGRRANMMCYAYIFIL